MRILIQAVSTFFGVGYLPYVPGTWGSAVAVVLAWYLPSGLEYWTVGLTAAGLWACAPARIVLGSEDPKPFVMDEVCGMAISVLWLPKTLVVYTAAFFLFRALDVWKPWLIGRIQNSKHPWSVMGDDLLAGVFVNGILQVAVRLFLKF